MTQEEKRKYYREYNARKRTSMTIEEKELLKEKRRKWHKARLARMTDEEYRIFREKANARNRKYYTTTLTEDQRKEKQLQDNARRKEKRHTEAIKADSNSKVCSYCNELKALSEFRKKGKYKTGDYNKICDSCLTTIYSRSHNITGGFDDPVFWRTKAYSSNRTALEAYKRKGILYNIQTLPFKACGEDIIKLYVNQNKGCFYCKGTLDIHFHIDHKQPLSRGGDHCIENLALTCPECNLLKHTKTDDEFMAFMTEYIKRFYKVLESEIKSSEISTKSSGTCC